MAARRDDPVARPRPRPGPGTSPVSEPAPPASPEPTAQAPQRPERRTSQRRPGRQLARQEQTSGSAIVTAARVGRLLGRSGWRVARQLPGVAIVEHQAARIAHVAAQEVGRLLEMPQLGRGSTPSPEEQRVMMLVQNAGSDPEPLRTAMSELLERSTESDGSRNRDYLFGSIVSQLVPDEARILALLANGHSFAVVDVVAKQVGRSTTRTVLTNASTVGAAAGIALPDNVPTYLTRLDNFGLLEFGTPGVDLDAQFETLLADPVVKQARQCVEDGKQGSAKIVRKSVSLSAMGRQFWTACAPSRPGLARRSG